MSNKQYWKTTSGDVIDVDSMTELHAKNCLKLMIRRHYQNQLDDQLKVKNEISDVDLVVKAHYLGHDLFPIETIDDVENFSTPTTNWKPRHKH